MDLEPSAIYPDVEEGFRGVGVRAAEGLGSLRIVIPALDFPFHICLEFKITIYFE